METRRRLSLPEIERKVCDIASYQLGVPRAATTPKLRLIEDLGCDSLDAVELVHDLERTFSVTLPEPPTNPVYKAVFTRPEFSLADAAELVYLQQGMTKPAEPVERSYRTFRDFWVRSPSESPESSPAPVPFTQLDGRWTEAVTVNAPLFERLPEDAGFRRRSDGMRCIVVPSAEVEIGCDLPRAPDDERPKHVVGLDSFLIDAEPVSTTAYCRFLNSIGYVKPRTLSEWFVLDPGDDRDRHMPIERVNDEWRPVEGAERQPMMLVSWYGANAYSLWANGRGWTDYRRPEAELFLPSEAQWEYAARGARFEPFPWGDRRPTAEDLRFDRHRDATGSPLRTLPMADVHERLGMSPFGLHHMAGNVWQWCRDWYDPAFYSNPRSCEPNPVNRTPTHVRSERGGSWVGPAELCRSSYRRGRNPLARGRCLGFRCLGVL